MLKSIMLEVIGRSGNHLNGMRSIIAWRKKYTWLASREARYRLFTVQNVGAATDGIKGAAY